MADETALTLINKLDFGDPLYLHPSDTTGTPLISYKLTGTENYNVWNRAMLLALGTKNKVGFIDGTCIKSTTDPAFAKLYMGQIFSNNASAIWKDLSDTYDSVDGSVTFNLHHKINSLTKSGSSVDRSSHANGFTAHNQLIKLMQFLMGLDDIYQPVRSNLLTRDPLPDVKTAFAVVSREESHRGLHADGKSNKTQASAFFVKNQNQKVQTPTFTTKPGFDNTRRGPNMNLKCDKCQKFGHTIERCFELKGYPPGYKKKNYNFNKSKNASNNSIVDNTNLNSNQDCSTSSSSVPLSFSHKQMMKILNLISDKSPTVEMSSNMSGMFINNSKLFNERFNEFFKFNSSKTMTHKSQGWIVDTGANQHITSIEECLFDVVDISKLHLTVDHPNGTQARIIKVGNLKLTDNITLFDVLVVPDYCVSLIFVSKLSKDSKLFVGFDESYCYIQDLKLMKTVGTGRSSGGLYLFNAIDYCKMNSSSCNAICYVSAQLWHQRLGHPFDQVLKVLKGHLKIDNTNISYPCDTCHRAKQIRDPFPLSEHKSKDLGDLVHLDLWGPFKIQSREGIKTIRTDNGSEFINQNLKNFCLNNGILHQTTYVYTPQQNGIAERKHRHLLNVARSLMFQGGLPLNMWSEYIMTATYLINRTPSYVLSGKSPYDLVFGVSPKLSHLKCFGCLCYATVLNNSIKFFSRSEKCFFIGYSNSKKDSDFFSQFQNNKNIPSDLNHLNLFDNLESVSKYTSSPNDEGRVVYDLGEGSSVHSEPTTTL
ncbi:uncharacterized protein [Rutidosis leptorrhynchoides]|uniref:uncharacterized protein n=1 Tax=Rutidosis leptorrhynchoides TaxID=125765 RepID=UPI003A995D59